MLSSFGASREQMPAHVRVGKPLDARAEPDVAPAQLSALGFLVCHAMYPGAGHRFTAAGPLLAVRSRLGPNVGRPSLAGFKESDAT